MASSKSGPSEKREKYPKFKILVDSFRTSNINRINTNFEANKND
jgi:hypothetical protein